MKPGARAADERGIVWFARAGQERHTEFMTRSSKEALGQLEIEHLGHEISRFGDLVDPADRIELRHQQTMIEMHHAATVNVIGPRIGINCTYVFSNPLFLCEEHHPS